MTFSEWYRESDYKDWNTECSNQYGFALKVTMEYEEWCEEHGITPIFDGK